MIVLGMDERRDRKLSRAARPGAAPGEERCLGVAVVGEEAVNWPNRGDDRGDRSGSAFALLAFECRLEALTRATIVGTTCGDELAAGIEDDTSARGLDVMEFGRKNVDLLVTHAAVSCSSTTPAARSRNVVARVAAEAAVQSAFGSARNTRAQLPRYSM